MRKDITFIIKKGRTSVNIEGGKYFEIGDPSQVAINGPSSLKLTYARGGISQGVKEELESNFKNIATINILTGLGGLYSPKKHSCSIYSSDYNFIITDKNQV